MADEIKKVEKEISKEVKKMGVSFWAIASIVLAVLLIGVLIFNFATAGISGTVAGQKVLKFIADQSQGNATNVSIVSVTSQGSVYQVVVEMQGQQVPVYVTKDGKSLIPPNGLIPLEAATPKLNSNTNSNTPAQTTTVSKSDKPTVQLFVMAYCPYGTQEEKGIIPVAQALGSKINFSINFVDYSMHESFVPEVEENLRQYCIEKTQPSVYLNYLSCFLSASNPQGTDANTTLCQQKAGVNVNLMNQCYTTADTQFNVTALKNDKSSWISGQFPQFNVEKDLNLQYNVQGSPTLIINGVESQANRDPESILQAVCAAFTTAPSECSKALSTAAPDPGFGSGTGATSGSPAAGCATTPAA